MKVHVQTCKKKLNPRDGNRRTNLGPLRRALGPEQREGPRRVWRDPPPGEAAAGSVCGGSTNLLAVNTAVGADLWEHKERSVRSDGYGSASCPSGPSLRLAPGLQWPAERPESHGSPFAPPQPPPPPHWPTLFSHTADTGLSPVRRA